MLEFFDRAFIICVNRAPQEKYDNNWWIGRLVKENEGLIGFIPSPIKLDSLQMMNSGRVGGRGKIAGSVTEIEDLSPAARVLATITPQGGGVARRRGYGRPPSVEKISASSHPAIGRESNHKSGP